MNVIVKSLEYDNRGSKYVTLTCGKKEAVVVERKDNSMNVLCVNASHKAYRGTGNEFYNVVEALNHYKSAQMKAMIECAVNSKVER